MEDFDTQALATARKMIDRIHREVELLAAIASGPRMAYPILRDNRITVDSFTQDDTRCLFVLLEHIGNDQGPPWDAQRMMLMARDLLRKVNCWDDNDLREFVSGSIWGPGPLLRLFTCCDFSLPMLNRSIIALRNEALHVTQ
jgi:hypothetical protein